MTVALMCTEVIPYPIKVKHSWRKSNILVQGAPKNVP